MFNWLFRNSAKSFLCLSHYTWGIKWKLETCTSARNGSLQSWTHQLELLWRNLCHQDPKSSHGLHQTVSGLRPRFSSKTRFCKFSASGGGWGQHLGLPPSPAARAAPNLQAGAPPPSRARAQGQSLLLQSEAVGRSPKATWPHHGSSLGKTQAFPEGANFALQELAEMNTGSNPEDKTKALQNHAHHPPTGYLTAVFFPER